MVCGRCARRSYCCAAVALKGEESVEEEPLVFEPKVMEEMPQSEWIMENSDLGYDVNFVNSKAVAPSPEMDTLRSTLASAVAATSTHSSHLQARLQAMCDMAKTTLGCAWAGISLVGQTTGQYMATSGFTVAPGHHFARDEMIDSHVIMSADHPLILLNTEQDVRCWGNTLIRTHSIGFYAGFPLVSASGLVIGALSVGDAQPREAFLRRKLQWAQLTLSSLIVTQLLEHSKLDEDSCPQEVKVEPEKTLEAELEQPEAEEEMSDMEMVNQLEMSLFGVDDGLQSTTTEEAVEQRLVETGTGKRFLSGKSKSRWHYSLLMPSILPLHCIGYMGWIGIIHHIIKT